jgi:hypothetical protein
LYYKAFGELRFLLANFAKLFPAMPQRNFNKQEAFMAVAETSLLFDTTPERIFAVLSDGRNNPKWELELRPPPLLKFLNPILKRRLQRQGEMNVQALKQLAEVSSS